MKTLPPVRIEHQVQHAVSPSGIEAPADPPLLRIVIYARLSKNRHGLSTNTAIQVAECEHEAKYYAKDHSSELVIVEKFEEDDVSASKFSTKPRPLYDQTLQLIRENKIDGIFATEMERLCRRPREMEDIIDLSETTSLRYIYFTTDYEAYDLRTIRGISDARAAVARADRESRKISERVKRKVAANASEGKSNGGRRAYGYKSGNMELELSEVAWLQVMRTKTVGGLGFRELAWWLNEQGVTTAEGHEWHASTIRAMLANTRYVGIRTHLGVEYPAAWPAVFTEEEWSELQLIVRARSEQYAGIPKPRKHLLTGFLVCGKCTHSLIGQKQYDQKPKPPRPVYKCAKNTNTSRAGIGCRGVTISAAGLEEYIRQQIIERLDTDNLARLLSTNGNASSQLKELLAKRKSKLAHRKMIEDERADGLLDRDEFYRMRNRVTEAIYRIDEQINQTRQKHVQLPIKAGQTIAEAWDENPYGWRRMLLERCVKHITIMPSHAKPRFTLRDGSMVIFDTKRVVINWRELSNADLYDIAALLNGA